MIPLELAKTLEEIPEHHIVRASEQYDTFKAMLKMADVFRKANMEPIFLADEDHQRFTVSSRETFNRPLH